MPQTLRDALFLRLPWSTKLQHEMSYFFISLYEINPIVSSKAQTLRTWGFGPELKLLGVAQYLANPTVSGLIQRTPVF